MSAGWSPCRTPPSRSCRRWPGARWVPCARVFSASPTLNTGCRMSGASVAVRPKSGAPGSPVSTISMRCRSLMTGSVLQARGWDWGGNATQITQYSLQFPWEQRPLDDVTGEAMAAEPGPSPTSALPYDAIAGSGASQPVAGRPNLHLATEDDLPSSDRRPVKMTPQESFEALRDEVEAMAAGVSPSSGETILPRSPSGSERPLSGFRNR